MNGLTYLIIDLPMTNEQQNAATTYGITNPRRPLDGTMKAIVGFESVPDCFSGILTYEKSELLPITTIMPWCDTTKFHR